MKLLPVSKGAKLLTAALLATTLLAGSQFVPTPPGAFAETEAAAIDPSKGFSQLVERVMPAVASVEVRFEQTAAEDFAMPELFREFLEQHPHFRERFEQPRRRGMGQGSGFVISADGYVVTNHHVVKGAETVKLRFQNGDEFDAKVVGSDVKTDLALLKIDTKKDMAFVSFDEGDAKVGDWVMAVGNPFGLGGTVTTGIVSARGRDIGSGPYDDYLQIDASINKGNSGGPAFNMEGKVIGVNTAIFSPSGGNVGIAFAIPANIVKDVVENLKTNGEVTRGWLGVQIQPVTEDLAEGLGLTEAKGAIISDLTENSPAFKAGLKQGDTILKANGEDIDDARDLSRTVAKLKPETAVPFEIMRNGKRETITVKIGKMPGEAPRMASTGENQKSLDLSDLGIEVVPAEDGAGMRITDLDRDAPAAELGLKPGDVILEIAGQPVASRRDVEEALENAKGKRILMLVRSGNNQRFITLPRSQG